MRIENHGALKEITLSSRDLKDTRVTNDITVFYKGLPLTKVHTLTFLLAPFENDEGNRLLLNDLGVEYGNKNVN